MQCKFYFCFTFSKTSCVKKTLLYCGGSKELDNSDHLHTSQFVGGKANAMSFLIHKKDASMVRVPVIPALRRLKLEGRCKVKASLRSIVRPCYKNKQTLKLMDLKDLKPSHRPHDWASSFGLQIPNPTPLFRLTKTVQRLIYVI